MAAALNRVTRGLPSVVKWGIFGGLVGRASNMAALIVLALIVQLDDYGRFSLHLSLQMSMLNASLLGLAITTVRITSSARHDPMEFAVVAIASLKLAVVVGACAASLGFIISKPLLDRAVGGDAGPGLARLGFLCIGFSVLYEVAQAIRLGGQRFRSVGLMDATRGAIGGLAVLAGAWLGGWSAAFMGFAVAETVSGCLALLLTVRFLPHRHLPRSRHRFSRVALGNLPPALATLVLQAAMWSAQATVAAKSGLVAFGIVALAMRWATPVWTLPGMFTNGFVAIVAEAGVLEDRHAMIRQATRRHMKAAAIVALVTGAPIALASPYLMGIAESAASSSLTLLAFVLYGITVSLGTVMASTQFAIGREKQWLLVEIIGAAVIFASALQFAQTMGGIAFPLALLAGTAVAALLRAPSWPGRALAHGRSEGTGA